MEFLFKGLINVNGTLGDSAQRPEGSICWKFCWYLLCCRLCFVTKA